MPEVLAEPVIEEMEKARERAKVSRTGIRTDEDKGGWPKRG